MGIVATACWRGYSDDSCLTNAKRCFGKDDLADRELGAGSISGLFVESSGVGIEAVDRHSGAGGDRLRSKLGGGDDEYRER